MTFRKLLFDLIQLTPTDRLVAAWTGCTIEVLRELWRICGGKMEEQKLRKLDFLWLMTWLKVYATWDVMSSLWGAHKTTYIRKVNETLYLLAETLDEVC
jgi:hypothetical protein